MDINFQKVKTSAPAYGMDRFNSNFDKKYCVSKKLGQNAKILSYYSIADIFQQKFHYKMVEHWRNKLSVIILNECLWFFISTYNYIIHLQMFSRVGAVWLV